MVAGTEVKPNCPEAAAPSQAMPMASTANNTLIANNQRLRKPSLNSLRAMFQTAFIRPPRSASHRPGSCSSGKYLPATADGFPRRPVRLH